MSSPRYLDDDTDDEFLADAEAKGTKQSKKLKSSMDKARGGEVKLVGTNPFEDIISGSDGAIDATTPPAGAIGATPEAATAPPELSGENPFEDVIKGESEPNPQDSIPILQKKIMQFLAFQAQNKNPAETAKNRFEAMGRGFVDVGEGAKQAYLRGKEALGFGTPGEADEYTKQADTERRLYEQRRDKLDPIASAMREGAASIPATAALAPLTGGGSFLARLGLGGATGGAAGATTYVPEGGSRKSNTAIGTVAGMAIPALAEAPGAIAKVAKSLTPTNLLSKMINSPLSSKELARNLEATAGTQTGLGDVVGSPWMKRLSENVITKIPLSGGDKALKQTGTEILKRGESLVDQYLGEHNPLHVTDDLGDALIQAHKDHTKIKNSLYKEAENIADDVGLKLELPGFTKLAREHIADIESTNVLKFQPKTQALLRKLNILKSPVKEGEEIGTLNSSALLHKTEDKNPSLKESNILASELRNLGNQYLASPEAVSRNAGGVLTSLAKALKNDIKQEIEASGSQELKSAFSTAEKNYGENFSNFLEKDIHKFTAGGKSPDELVSSFLQTSNTKDKADQLQKIMKVLPKDKHDLLKFAYFARAIEGAEGFKAVNPNKLATAWEKLGDKQKQILMPSAAERRKFDNYVSLVRKNPKAVNLMWNPATGQINSDIVGALMLAHPGSALKELIMARGANKMLTSPKVRKDVVKNLIERKKKKGE